PALEPPVKPAVPVVTRPSPQTATESEPAPIPKPRPMHIWDSALWERRDAIISAAGFADLYTMRLDIRFRQEQLRAKGLFKEEGALNALLASVNAVIESKKKSASLE